MNTLYYGENLKVRIPPTLAGSEAFKKACKAEKSGAKQEGLGI